MGRSHFEIIKETFERNPEKDFLYNMKIAIRNCKISKTVNKKKK